LFSRTKGDLIGILISLD